RRDERFEAMVHDVAVELHAARGDAVVEVRDRSLAQARQVIATLILGARIADAQERLDLALGAALVHIVARDLRDLAAHVVLVGVDADAAATTATDDERRDHDIRDPHNPLLAPSSANAGPLPSGIREGAISATRTLWLDTRVPELPDVTVYVERLRALT